MQVSDTNVVEEISGSGKTEIQNRESDFLDTYGTL